MPLWFFPALIGLLGAVSLMAGVWLLLHLPAVVALFSGKADLVRGRARRTASKGAVWTALIIFNGGWIACIIIWILVIGGDANQMVDAAA
ncbi:hypothetical protein RM533_01985 [Croceicoccus sp. F390]|uniref:Uncharacterized protein n=1 Tax=Croceicoccus esteveae TaxID=3075597 RepID=A0ABU2ZEX9_9SPHN|nr:hypothetical protein [Croceicoccus sp. F390]MDT0574950.1 hypothetical protein [Croceicoccus sp. F390]